MKRVLAVVIAVAFISIGASIAGAQVPNFTVYFDQTLYQQQAHCEDHFFNQPDSLFVVANNFNMFINTVEFALDWQCDENNRIRYFGDSHVNNPQKLGTSTSGVTITWGFPQNGFDPFVCMKVLVLWKCDVCVGPPCSIVVVDHPSPLAGLLAIEWQTFRVVDAVGMTSVVCPGAISTEETSWGKMKALYNN